jgi:hypothetical protein
MSLLNNYYVWIYSGNKALRFNSTIAISNSYDCYFDREGYAWADKHHDVDYATEYEAEFVKPLYTLVSYTHGDVKVLVF